MFVWIYCFLPLLLPPEDLPLDDLEDPLELLTLPPELRELLPELLTLPPELRELLPELR